MALSSSPLHRVHQGLLALRPRLPDNRDAILAQRLSPEQATAFRQLPAHDQAHLLRVHETLRRRGVTDPDLLVAGLLHDIGKVSSRGHTHLVDRTINVVLARVAPSLRARLTRRPRGRWGVGIFLAVHHARLGAERAATLGCSERVCWLIAHHEDIRPADDAELELLMSIDHDTP